MEYVPVLDLGDRVGSTHYIDFVRAEDMHFPLMRGTDFAGRPFVAVKTKTTGGACEFPEVVGVFFQRYTNNADEWAFGTCYPLNLIFHDSRVREHHMIGLGLRLNLLASGNTIRNFDHGLNDDWIYGNGDIQLCI